MTDSSSQFPLAGSGEFQFASRYGWVPRAVLAAAVAYAAIAATIWIAGQDRWIIAQAAVVALACAALWPASHGNPRPVGLVVAALIWSELTFTLFREANLAPSSVIVYPMLMTAAGLLLPRWGALAWAVASGLAIPLALLGGHALGHQPPSGFGQGFTVLVVEISLVASAFFAQTVMQHFRYRHLETERQRRKFMAVFHQIPDCLIEFDGSGTVSEVNAAAERLFGTNRDELVGRSLAQLFAAHGMPAPDIAPNPGVPVAQPLLSRPGTPDVRHWDVLVSTDADAGDRSLVVVRDVTNQRLLGERQAELQRLETVGRLAAGIAHDFNNLLTAIGGHASLLNLHADPEVQRYADIISRAQQRGAKLTQQMLSFARRSYHEPKVVLVAHEMLEWTDLFRRVVGRELTLELKGEGGCFIEVDRIQLEQALVNLLSNARDASPAGATVELHVTRLVQAEAGRLGSTLGAARQVMFAVVDHGTGMPPEIKRHLFEPFFTTKPPGQGTGMGLAATYGLVVQNHGMITVETEVGRGTEVRVFFPERSAPAVR